MTVLKISSNLERVGDYAKNLYDLVKYGQDFDAAPDRDELVAYRPDAEGLFLVKLIQVQDHPEGAA